MAIILTGPTNPPVAGDQGTKVGVQYKAQGHHVRIIYGPDEHV